MLHCLLALQGRKCSKKPLNPKKGSLTKLSLSWSDLVRGQPVARDGKHCSWVCLHHALSLRSFFLSRSLTTGWRRWHKMLLKCISLFLKKPLIIGLFYNNWPFKKRHPILYCSRHCLNLQVIFHKLEKATSGKQGSLSNFFFLGSGQAQIPPKQILKYTFPEIQRYPIPPNRSGNTLLPESGHVPFPPKQIWVCSFPEIRTCPISPKTDLEITFSGIRASWIPPKLMWPSLCASDMLLGHDVWWSRLSPTAAAHVNFHSWPCGRVTNSTSNTNQPPTR